MQNCINLRRLDVNSSNNICIVHRGDSLSRLQEFSLCFKGNEWLFPSVLCYNIQLEYLLIFVENNNDAVDRFLMQIDTTKLKHLILRYLKSRNRIDVSDIMEQKLDALEILEIGATKYVLTLDTDWSSGEMNMKKLRLLKIECKRIESEFVRAMTQLESLTDLYITLPSDSTKIYKDFLNQLGRKESLKVLFVDSSMPLNSLEKSIRNFKNLKVLSTGNIFEYQPTENDAYDIEKGYDGRSEKTSPNSFTSEDLKYPFIKVFYFQVIFQVGLQAFIPLNVPEVFANVEKLVIKNSKSTGTMLCLQKVTNEQYTNMKRSIAAFIDTFVKKYGRINVLVIDCENEKSAKLFFSDLLKTHLTEWKLTSLRYEWSQKNNERRVIQEFQR